MILTSKINKMRSFLLFLLVSLMKGCEAWSEGSEESVVKGCPTEWLEFTCKYTATNRKYIDVVTPKESIKTTERNVWENKGRVSLYNDTKNNNLRVVIKQLAHEDFGNYTCKFQDNEIKKLELEVETDGCQRQFIQTAYRTAKTTITCDYTGNKYKFFCKQNGSICEDILSTKSSLKSKGTFTLTETNSGFSMSISNVSSHDAGVYWCGKETHEGSYRAALRKIQLEVEEIKSFTRYPTIGQDLTYWCQYSNGVYVNKFICKGEDPSICQPLVSIAQRNKKTGKFSMEDEKSRENVTITVREVTTDDTGTYWCGAESTDKTHSNKFFQKLVMTVVSPTSSTTLVSSTPTTVSAESRGDSPVIITVIVCVAVLLLLLLLIFILIYKRYSHSKNTRKGAAAQNIREDYVYEEIQQPVQAPDSGTEMNTIYANANFPTNPSASLHYSTINFQSSCDRADGEAVILKPSSAACEYSTVKRSETYSTVNQPSSSSEDPLYTTVNKPQQH